MAACGFDICAAPARNDTSRSSIASRDATAEHEGAPLQVSSRRVTKRQQRAILRRPMHAKDLHAKDLRATDLPALRFALAITWVVYRLGRLELGSAAKRERKLIPRTGNVFSGAPDARVRGTAHTMAHRHGSETWRFSVRTQMSSFAAASTIPVTNKVAHANSRKSLRIRVITSPMRTAPCTADVPRTAADVMGIPPTLRRTPDGSIGSPPDNFF